MAGRKVGAPIGGELNVEPRARDVFFCGFSLPLSGPSDLLRLIKLIDANGKYPKGDSGIDNDSPKCPPTHTQDVAVICFLFLVGGFFGIGYGLKLSFYEEKHGLGCFDRYQFRVAFSASLTVGGMLIAHAGPFFCSETTENAPASLRAYGVSAPRYRLPENVRVFPVVVTPLEVGSHT
jgi:hypothetical protein